MSGDPRPGSPAGGGDTSFTGSIPQIYDTLLVPMIFAEPARLIARAVAATGAVDILETAAGTGVLTRALARLEGRDIVATDLNEPMLTTAANRSASDRVRWQVADAGHLPFAACSFDLVACQFGVMFLPDKVAGYAEALRVLRPGGVFAFNVWDRLETNAVALVVTEALCAAAPVEPLEFFRRTPHGYFDIDRIRGELAEAGFEHITGEYLEGSSRSTAETAAMAFCQGTPLRGEIERHPSLDLESATAIAAEALRGRYGSDEFDAPMRWLQMTARRPDRVPETRSDRREMSDSAGIPRGDRPDHHDVEGDDQDRPPRIVRQPQEIGDDGQAQ